MKNLKKQFKLIIFLILFFNNFNLLSSKENDKWNDADNITNYFSGIIAINDNKYQESYDYLKNLKDLEESHYVYSQYYQYSLITLNKFKDAFNFSKKLEDEKIDNFESNLITVIYYLKANDLNKSLYYLEKLTNKSQPGTLQNLVSSTLNTWINIKKVNDLELGLKLLNNIPQNFENIKKIQSAFAHCYFDSTKTSNEFSLLTSNPAIDFSRYYFFYINYLNTQNNSEALKILDLALSAYPKNLILNQLKIDLSESNKISNQFDCKNPVHVIAEMLYVVANALASQDNFAASNFYLNIASYLNPEFGSFKTLYAENFYNISEFDTSKNIYLDILKQGAVYRWHADKQIASILIRQDQKEEAIKHLKNSYEKLKNPNEYQIFEYAEFLKNNEQYEDSIKFYSEILKVIDKNHNLYAQVLDGRGVAYERTNQWDKAEIDLLNSLKASPNNAYVINYLAYSWIEKGMNIEKSLDMLRKANSLKPNDGYIIDSLGWALFKLKRYKEAKSYLELAIQRMASDPVVNDHYADSLWMNNQSLQARYYWNYVLKLEKTDEKLKNSIKDKLVNGLKL
jgi:tetratricopeptide (TPR) repeat protein